MKLFRLVILLWSVAMFSSFGGEAYPQSYPTKAITIIVPWAPGGGNDLTTRILVNFLSQEWGVPVNVVNKEGGNTLIGTLEVMKSKPDGYTILADSPGSATLQVLLPGLPYKIEDRTHLANLTAKVLVYAVNNKSPWKNLSDVATAAQKDPENFKWGSLGGVSVADLALKQYFAAAGTDLSRTKIVKFKGAGDAVIALAGGHIDFTSGGVGAVKSYVQSALVRVIGVTAPTKDHPEVKTATDQGFKGATATSWTAYSGPPGLPKFAVSVWEQTLEKLTKSPEFQKRVESIGDTPMFLNSGEFRRVVLKEIGDAREFFGVQGK